MRCMIALYMSVRPLYWLSVPCAGCKSDRRHTGTRVWEGPQANYLKTVFEFAAVSNHIRYQILQAFGTVFEHLKKLDAAAPVSSYRHGGDPTYTLHTVTRL